LPLAAFIEEKENSEFRNFGQKLKIGKPENLPGPRRKFSLKFRELEFSELNQKIYI